MQNPLRVTLLLLFAASVLPNSVAQQTPPPAKAQPATPPKSQQGAATKTPRAPAKTQTPLTLKTRKDKTSYAMAMTFGTGLRNQSIEIYRAILERCATESFANCKT